MCVSRINWLSTPSITRQCLNKLCSSGSHISGCHIVATQGTRSNSVNQVMELSLVGWRGFWPTRAYTQSLIMRWKIATRKVTSNRGVDCHNCVSVIRRLPPLIGDKPARLPPFYQRLLATIAKWFRACDKKCRHKDYGALSRDILPRLQRVYGCIV